MSPPQKKKKGYQRGTRALAETNKRRLQKPNLTKMMEMRVTKWVDGEGLSEYMDDKMRCVCESREGMRCIDGSDL